MQSLLTLETNKYAIKIENFEGPLDLLCHLIDKNKMDIYDVKISEIAEILEIPEGTVKSRLSNAKAKLYEELISGKESEKNG